jgi:hypothetical protein
MEWISTLFLGVRVRSIPHLVQFSGLLNRWVTRGQLNYQR